MSYIEIDGTDYSLSDIEHDIIREDFSEPRIHFAIVCASASCPELLNGAYTADQLDVKLNIQVRKFLSDTSKNIITKDYMKLSPIFDWFEDDFTKEGSIVDYINLYSNEMVNNGAEVTFTKYNWNLNE